jgi:hypothetical protein
MITHRFFVNLSPCQACFIIIHDIIKNGCHAEPVEAWWARHLRATLRQAAIDKSITR